MKKRNGPVFIAFLILFLLFPCANGNWSGEITHGDNFSFTEGRYPGSVINTSYEPNEVTDLRNRFSSTYYLGEGKYKTVISPGAKHFLTEDNTWKPIDLRIKQISQSQKGGNSGKVLGCMENSLQVIFPRTATSKDGNMDAWHWDAHVSPSNENYGLSWKFAGIGSPQKSGIIQYKEAKVDNSKNFGMLNIDTAFPGISERYTIQNGILKHDIILSQPPKYEGEQEKLKIWWQMDKSDSLSIEPLYSSFNQETNREDISRIAFRDFQGKGLMFNEIIAYSEYFNNTNLPTSSPGSSFRMGNYEIIQDDGNLFVGACVPMEFFLDPETAYPVVIDPTTHIIKSSSGSGKDAFICEYTDPVQGDNRNWNMGADEFMFISLDQGAYWKTFRSLISFDLQGFEYNHSIEIINASLNLYCYNDEGGNPSNSIQISVHSLSRAWEEGPNVWGPSQNGYGVNWNTYDGSTPWTNQGGDYAPVALDSEWVDDYGWFDWNVLGPIKDFLSGEKQNYGFLMRGSSGGDHLKYFYSSESGLTSRRPFLEIGYAYRPKAEIVEISPGRLNITEEVGFKGRGTGLDGEVVQAKWESNIDGILSDQFNFSTSSLTEGTHTISFLVKDTNNIWSIPVQETVFVDNPPPPDLENLQARDTEADQGHSITLTWEPTNVTDFDSYRIYVSYLLPIGNINNMIIHSTIQDQDIAMARIEEYGGSPLLNNVDYFFAVVPVDIKSNFNSNPVSLGPIRCYDNTDPPPVTDLEVVDTPNDQGMSLTLRWRPPLIVGTKLSEDIFHHYEIFIEDKPFNNITYLTPEDTEELDQIDDHETTLETHNGMDLQNEKDYYLAVIPFDVSGNYPRDISSFGPVRCRDDLPPPAVNIIIDDLPDDNGEALKVTWEISKAEDLLGYYIFISEKSFINTANMEPQYEVKGQADQWVIRHSGSEKLSPDKVYYISVIPVDTSFNGKWDVFSSEGISPIDQQAPEFPQFANASDRPYDNGDGILLDWSPSPSDDIFQYIVFVSINEPFNPDIDTEELIRVSANEERKFMVTSIGEYVISPENTYYFALNVEDKYGNKPQELFIFPPFRPRDDLPPEIINTSSGSDISLNESLVVSRLLYSKTFVHVYENSSEELFIEPIIETQNDTVYYEWIIDETIISTEDSLILNLSRYEAGTHTLFFKVEDGTYEAKTQWNITILEEPIDPDQESSSSSSILDNSILIILIPLGIAIFVIVILIIRKKKNSNKDGEGINNFPKGQRSDIVIKAPEIALIRTSPPPALKKSALAKIVVRKKAVYVTDGRSPAKKRNKPEGKGIGHYLDDKVSQQLALKKKKYKPKEKGPCPMVDTPRSEFECPESVVIKCGLVCTQKNELGMPQPRKNEVLDENSIFGSLEIGGGKNNDKKPDKADPIPTKLSKEGKKLLEKKEQLKLPFSTEEKDLFAPFEDSTFKGE